MVESQESDYNTLVILLHTLLEKINKWIRTKSIKPEFEF